MKYLFILSLVFLISFCTSKETSCSDFDNEERIEVKLPLLDTKWEEKTESEFTVFLNQDSLDAHFMKKTCFKQADRIIEFDYYKLLNDSILEIHYIEPKFGETIDLWFFRIFSDSSKVLKENPFFNHRQGRQIGYQEALSVARKNNITAPILIQ